MSNTPLKRQMTPKMA